MIQGREIWVFYRQHLLNSSGHFLAPSYHSLKYLTWIKWVAVKSSRQVIWHWNLHVSGTRSRFFVCSNTNSTIDMEVDQATVLRKAASTQYRLEITKLNERETEEFSGLENRTDALQTTKTLIQLRTLNEMSHQIQGRTSWTVFEHWIPRARGGVDAVASYVQQHNVVSSDFYTLDFKMAENLRSHHKIIIALCNKKTNIKYMYIKKTSNILRPNVNVLDTDAAPKGTYVLPHPK